MARHRSPRPAASSAWEDQAQWYDARHGSSGDDLYQQVVAPTVLRLLDLRPEERVLDLGCGPGVLGRHLALQGVRVTGIDASPAMIAAATEQAGARECYLVGDAGDADLLPAEERFDAVCVVLALQDMAEPAPVLAHAARRCRAGGRVVLLTTHPCFRIPQHSDWHHDRRRDVQARLVDRYLSDGEIPIRTHPGRGKGETLSHHRPLMRLVGLLAAAGLAVDGCEEPCSPRRGSSGSASAREDRAAREIPLFLALRARPYPG